MRKVVYLIIGNLTILTLMVLFSMSLSQAFGPDLYLVLLAFLVLVVGPFFLPVHVSQRARNLGLIGRLLVASFLIYGSYDSGCNFFCDGNPRPFCICRGQSCSENFYNLKARNNWEDVSQSAREYFVQKCPEFDFFTKDKEFLGG